MGKGVGRMIFGQHDDKTLAQLRDVSSRAEHVALMADGHMGYVMPIGGVAAYRNKVSVVGVGFDIACGNCAIRTDLRYDQVAAYLPEYADEIAGTISFGVGRHNRADDAPTDHPLFVSPAWEAVPAQHRRSLLGKARSQLGTVGGGNHYVDVFRAEDGAVWVGVHFGSRGFGHTVASGFLALSQGKEWGERVPENETLLSLSDPIGHDYWHLMSLAGEYAYAGREWVARKVVNILGGSETDLVHNHHNFAWKEAHYGEEFIVVRKGATPAFPGQRGFVGGSMGDQSVILRGSAAGSTQQAALFSTVHGAGRVMGRMQAKGKWKNGRCVRPGAITVDDWREWMAPLGVELRGGDLDEAPQAYKRLHEVISAQGDTIEVEECLTPLIVCMAPARTFDPYKD